MTFSPTHAEIMARPRTAQVGLWMRARTRVGRRYPCTCILGQPCKNWGHPGYFCRCWGRPDIQAMPQHCCSRAFRFHRAVEVPT